MYWGLQLKLSDSTVQSEYIVWSRSKVVGLTRSAMWPNLTMLASTDYALAIIRLMRILKNKCKNHNLWRKQWLLKRSEYSQTNLFKELKNTLHNLNRTLVN